VAEVQIQHVRLRMAAARENPWRFGSTMYVNVGRALKTLRNLVLAAWPPTIAFKPPAAAEAPLAVLHI